MYLRANWPYLIIILFCIAGYFVSNRLLSQSIIEREIVYSSNTASELYIVWGPMKGGLPPKKVWPPNSYQDDKVIYTKMREEKGTFSVRLKMPVGVEIYYWIVQKKDKQGTDTDIWDTGGPDKIYYTLTFNQTSIFKPGYFIFLAGFIPLAILYWRNKNKRTLLPQDNLFKINEYIPQFDSIRAIAVLLVIIHHWLPEIKALNFLPNGRLGVNIFFVLSGFLITGILMKSRRQLELKRITKRKVFRIFYIRRTLRIFPIYYLVLLIFLIFMLAPIREGTAYYFSYTSNYLFYSDQFFPRRLAHLWSLAVEEQFYLLWPWLIILISRRLLPYVIGLFFVLGVSTNYIFTDKGWWVEIFTPACFDAFAVGGFLAYIVNYRQDIITKIQPNFRAISAAIFILFLLDVFNLSFLPSRTSHSLFAIVIIYYCLFKNNYRVPNYILNHKALKYIGKISYGIYLYHLFVPEIWMWINQQINKLGIDPFFNQSVSEAIKPFWLFLQYFSFLMLICILSWKLIEKPINNLKSKFQNTDNAKRIIQLEAASDNTFSY